MAGRWLSDRSIGLRRGVSLRCRQRLSFQLANEMQGFHVKVITWPIEGGVVNGSLAKDQGRGG